MNDKYCCAQVFTLTQQTIPGTLGLVVINYKGCFLGRAHYSGAKENPTMKREVILLNRKLKTITWDVGLGGIVLKKYI